MRTTPRIWLVFAVVLIAMSGCKDDSVAPEPCAGYRYEPPSITAHEWVASIETEIQDTIFGQTLMKFRSTKKSTRYYWTTYFDTTRLWTDSVLALRFMNYRGPVTVRLITFTEQDTICGDRDGYDTTYRTFFVLSEMTDKSHILGKFFGYTTERPNDPLVVEINTVGTGPNRYQIKINLPIGCSYPSNPEKFGYVPFDFGWNTIVYNHTQRKAFWYDNCKNMSATGILSPSGDTLNLQYSFIEPTDDDPYPDESYRRSFSFTGVRQ